MPINLLELDPDRMGAYTVWLTKDGKWHASGHWYAFLVRKFVWEDASSVARWPEVVAAFAVAESSRYRAVKKAQAMLNTISLEVRR